VSCAASGRPLCWILLWLFSWRSSPTHRCVRSPSSAGLCGQRVCIHILSRCAILPTYTAIRVPFQRSSATYGYLLRFVTAVVLVRCILLRSVEWPIPIWSSFRYFRHCWPTRVVLSPCVGAYAIVIYLYSSCRPWASRIGAVCVYRPPADRHQIIIAQRSRPPGEDRAVLVSLQYCIVFILLLSYGRPLLLEYLSPFVSLVIFYLIYIFGSVICTRIYNWCDIVLYYYIYTG
jgi:hypothetical protein